MSRINDVMVVLFQISQLVNSEKDPRNINYMIIIQ